MWVYKLWFQWWRCQMTWLFIIVEKNQNPWRLWSMRALYYKDCYHWFLFRNQLNFARLKRREKATIRVNRCDVMMSHSLDTGGTKSYPSESSNSWDTRCPKSHQTECKHQPSFNSTTITSVQLEKRKLNFENCTRL